MTDPSTFGRELAPFARIRDNYPKLVLTLDRFTPGNYQGVLVVNIVDWLAEKAGV